MYHKPGDVFIAACVCAYVSEGTFHDRKCFAVTASRGEGRHERGKLRMALKVMEDAKQSKFGVRPL